MNLSCFHCGLPVLNDVFPISYREVTHSTCCAGCQAVVCSIVDAGLDFYYEQRTETATPLTDELLGRLHLYDDEVMQREFVYEQDGLKQATLLLTGMRCAACAWLIEQKIMRLAGMVKVSVNYSTKRLSVTWRPEAVVLSQILHQIHAIGYQAQPYDVDQSYRAQQCERQQWWIRLWVAGLSMMQVMMYVVPGYLYRDSGTMEIEIVWLLHWASLVLTLPVVVYCAWPFYQGAWQNMRVRRVGMDTPVSLAIVLAFGGSVYALLKQNQSGVYFDSISMFVFFLLSARYLEQWVSSRIEDVGARLSQLVPDFCHVLPQYPQQQVQESLVVHLEVGNVVLVKAGEIIPVDGVVLEGCSEINQAILTGEAMPISKTTADMVQAGTLNVMDNLYVQAASIGQDTSLASMVRAFDEAAAYKPHWVKMADKYASWFLSGMLVLGVVAFVYWYLQDGFEQALMILIALWVIACPCALSLATPMTLTVATSVLARKGLWLKNAKSLETMAQVTDVVFDKTGTLTTGQFELVQTILQAPYSEIQVKAYAAALEQASDHLLAAAFLREVEGMALPDIQNWQHVVGGGVWADIDHQCWALGRAEWVSEVLNLDIERPEDGLDEATWVVMGNQNHVVAWFGLQDTIKSEVPNLIANLKKQGLQVHLLSGDAKLAVASVAEKLNLHSWQHSCTPEAKWQFVRNLQQQKRCVMVIGDGLNDVLVLKQADVSIGVANGLDVTLIGSDIMLLQTDVGLVATGLQDAVRVRRVMQENFGWAAFYNVLAIPLAMMGWVTPWLAALGMGVSSLCVTLNAMRLLKGSD